MKKTITVRRLSAVLGAAVLSLGFLFTPETASAKGPDHHNNNGKGHYNQSRYGWYNRGYRQNPYWNKPVRYYNPPRTYEYYRGNRGYWENQGGVRIFINL